MTAATNSHSEIFEEHRRLLFSVAYRMLGSVMDAEDMVQETYLRFAAIPLETISSPKAFLSTITTRLCLDFLKSAKVKREEYIGPWLPEPIVTGEESTEIVNQQELISMAALVMLENLSPVERATLILRDVLDYSYAEISQIIERSESNCRQYYHRAKEHLVDKKPRFTTNSLEQKKLVQSLLQAMQAGDYNELKSMIAEDAILWSDGGGKAIAARRPHIGHHEIANMLAVSWRKRPPNLKVKMVELNGLSSVMYIRDGKVVGVMSFAGDGTKIDRLWSVWNPDKLRHLNA